MAQSALTVTPPSPTPPTNMSFTGATPPNPPNFTKLTYANYNGGGAMPSYITNPPPFFDDGTAGALHTFAANTAALASGTGATSGGTEGSYPGAASGAVPASTSVAHEGAGTEVTVLAPGNIIYTYPGGGTLDMSRTASTGPVQTALTLAAGPNASHASTLSGSAVPTTSAASGASNVSGAGTTLLTVTGTNFNRSSVVYVNGIAQTTNYVSATSLTVTNAPKRATAGTLPVTVVNGVGGTPSNATSWTFT
jgi:hypothetical protein